VLNDLPNKFDRRFDATRDGSGKTHARGQTFRFATDHDDTAKLASQRRHQSEYAVRPEIVRVDHRLALELERTALVRAVLDHVQRSRFTATGDRIDDDDQLVSVE
jgi:hypothetical protein